MTDDIWIISEMRRKGYYRHRRCQAHHVQRHHHNVNIFVTFYWVAAKLYYSSFCVFEPFKRNPTMLYNHESSQYVLSNIVLMLLILLTGFFFVVAVCLVILLESQV